MAEKFKIKRAKTPESGDESGNKEGKNQNSDSDDADQDESFEDSAVRGTANEQAIQ